MQKTTEIKELVKDRYGAIARSKVGSHQEATCEVAAAFGGRIAGFIFIGTAGAALEERDRPQFEEILEEWSPRG